MISVKKINLLPPFEQPKRSTNRRESAVSMEFKLWIFLLLPLFIENTKPGA